MHFKFSCLESCFFFCNLGCSPKRRVQVILGFYLTVCESTNNRISRTTLSQSYFFFFCSMHPDRTRRCRGNATRVWRCGRLVLPSRLKGVTFLFGFVEVGWVFCYVVYEKPVEPKWRFGQVVHERPGLILIYLLVRALYRGLIRIIYYTILEIHVLGAVPYVTGDLNTWCNILWNYVLIYYPKEF